MFFTNLILENVQNINQNCIVDNLLLLNQLCLIYKIVFIFIFIYAI